MEGVFVTNISYINAAIKAELSAQGLTQSVLATYLGFANRRQIVARLSGETPWNVTELFEVAKFLNITLFKLFELAAEREVRDKKAGE